MATDHGDDHRVRMCEPDVSLVIVDKSSVISADFKRDAKYIVLCDPALTRSDSMESTESQFDVIAIKALPGVAGFYEGKTIDNIAYATCLSFTIVYQIMSLSQPSLC